MFPRIEIAAEKRQQAYVYYACHPERSLQDIANFLGVSMSTFGRLRQKWNWPSRLAALAQHEEDRLAGQDGTLHGMTMAATSLHEAARSLARATQTQINALVDEQRAGGATDHDKTARALASYAKTLAAAQALLEQEGSTLDGHEHHDTSARSIHELRDELARHLERVIAEEEARGSDGLLL